MFISINILNSSWDLLRGSFYTTAGILGAKDIIRKGINGYAVKELDPIDKSMIGAACLTIYFACESLLAYKGYEESMWRSITSITVSAVNVLALTFAAKKGNRFAASIIATCAAALSVGLFIIGAIYLTEGVKGMRNYFFPPTPQPVIH